jgi:hypothetical protein
MVIRQIAAKANAGLKLHLKVFSDFAKKLLTNFAQLLLTITLAPI